MIILQEIKALTMSNKFLGLDSINVIKEYIDERIVGYANNLSVITFQAYKYCLDGDTIVAPTAGGYDMTIGDWKYPDGWSSLKDIMATDPDLSVGSIYMSVGVQTGGNPIDENWSIPVKISGQNGVSVMFQYAYDVQTPESQRSAHPQGPTSEHPVEYVWSKTGDGAWEGPNLWAKYSETPKSVLWRYCVTGDNNDHTPITPSRPGVGNVAWASDISTLNLSQSNPNLWMSWKVVVPDENYGENFSNPSGEGWSEPILYGHYGLDGNVPDYTQTLYRRGYYNIDLPDLPGIVAPARPEFIPNGTIEDYIKDGWVELPDTEDAPAEGDFTIWWQCTFKVDGRTNKVVDESYIGAVKRYSAVDGVAKPGPYTKCIFCWSESQSKPNESTTLIDGWRPDNWSELPDRPLSMTSPEASLWMKTYTMSGLDENGLPIVSVSSEPVKLTGPRGPIGYDYRMEVRYMRGNEQGPEYEPDVEEWSLTTPTTNSDYPYVWAKSYLTCYKMEYGEFDEIVNDYKVVPTGDYEFIEDYPYFMMSGSHGRDGNRRNSINYSTEAATVDVKSFSTTNYYISNSTEDVTYNMDFDKLTFINGYTGKFANIGTGAVILNGGTDFVFCGSGVTTDTITLAPQETVELVTYNAGSTKQLIVIGKSLTA
jgi:hypothetical protein